MLKGVPRNIMQVLALSDQAVPYIHSPRLRERYRLVDLVVGCGDLPVSYLDYVVSALNVPMVCVPGNHDPDHYRVPGGINIDGAIVRIRRLTIAGLGGSPRYKNEGRHQHSESGMHLRMLPLLPRLILRRLKTGNGADLLVTHAPPRGIHDEPDPAHRGFQALRHLLRLARPRLLLHGHTHLWGETGPIESVVFGCRVVNVFPAQVVNLEPSG